jgi:hypothetical protein
LLPSFSYPQGITERRIIDNSRKEVKRRQKKRKGEIDIYGGDTLKNDKQRLNDGGRPQGSPLRDYFILLSLIYFLLSFLLVFFNYLFYTPPKTP